MKKLLLLLAFFAAITINAQQLAFPGAEGFGKYATGGRTGTVYHVTNLNDSGTGSFRDAVSQSNRIVVFDVGGIIKLNSVCVVNKNITIAGQTAPGDGITITGERLAFNGSSGNNIVRYIRVRLPRAAGTTDAMSISDNADNLIFDHISVTWGADGTFDINTGEAENITIQDCIIGQGADWHGHSTGGLIQCGPISIIRTLWIDNNTRNPKIRFQHEFINCVLYNWGTNGFIMGDTDNADSYCNMMGNYFIAGPSGSATNYFTRSTTRYHVYEKDNWLDGDKNGILNGNQLIAANGDYLTATVVSSPYAYPGVDSLLSAQDAVTHIINNVGPSITRDAVDELLIDQLKSYGTKGAIIIDENSNGIPNGGLGYVFNGPKPADTDNDGMPDQWENTNGTNINSNDAMTVATNGYTNIENYINSINGPVIPWLKHPSNINSSAQTTNSITLTWTNNDTTAENIIIKYGTTAANLSNQTSVTGTATTATIQNLTSGTVYYFSLKATNSNAESAYTDATSAKTQEEPTAPVACSSPAPQNSSTLNILDNVVLEWDNTTNNLGGTLYYNVYFGTAADQMTLVSSDQTAKLFSVGTLNASSTYFWRISTTNTLGTNEGITWSFNTGSGANKLLHIPFNETSGTVAQNLAGNNANAINSFSPSWGIGHDNNCLFFNASPANGCMSVNHYSDLAFGISSFSISCWFKSTGGGLTDIYLIHKGTHSATSGTLGSGKWVGIQYKPGERLTFAIDDNATKTDLNFTTNPNQYFNNQWHHLVCIRDVATDKLKMYIDGSKVAETTDNTGNITELAELVIGNCNYNFNTPYYGYLDNLIIFSGALTDNEIAVLYNSSTSDIEKHPVKTNSITTSPNPFDNSLTVNGYFNNSNYTLQIFDLTGKLLLSTIAQPQNNQFKIENLSNLPAGIYSISVFDNSNSYFTKMIKK
ncbi:MAG: T9SS type A sorting domain-containing protein [Marinilabiliaceae bacterium]|nr:T9SS type A sorting domain-containing protein [Marinilabiliaceae bacterium]